MWPGLVSACLLPIEAIKEESTTARHERREEKSDRRRPMLKATSIVLQLLRSVSRFVFAKLFLQQHHAIRCPKGLQH